MIRITLKNKKGSALLMTVLMLAGMITVALNASSVVMSGTILSGVQERSTLAFYAAESGAERFLYEARINNNMPSVNTVNMYGTTTLSNNAFFTVDFSTSTTKINVSSVGVYLETKRVIGISF